RLYNLLGDPATSITLPSEAIEQLTINSDHHLTGLVRGVEAGDVVVQIQTARPATAHPEKIVPVADNDAELDAKAAVNYPLANQRTLAELHGAVHDGRFDVLLPNPLPASAAIISVCVTSKHGEVFIGAQRLEGAATQPMPTITSNSSP